MMTGYRFFLSLVLIAVLLAACASKGATVPPEQPAAVMPSPTVLPTVDTPTLQAAPTEALTPLPVATSRGPDLQATDPATVSLASGGLQFVEFFRFT